MSERKNKSLKNQPKEKEATPEVKTVKSTKKEAVPAAKKNYFTSVIRFVNSWQQFHDFRNLQNAVLRLFLLLFLKPFWSKTAKVALQFCHNFEAS